MHTSTPGISPRNDLDRLGPAATVTVRYFAGARAAAAIDQETVTVTTLSPDAAPTVTDLVATLSQLHGADLTRVMAACSFLVNEVAGNRERVLADGVTVDVLPPFAGG